MIKIKVNGEIQEIESSELSELVSCLNFPGPYAVAVNRSVVPRSEFQKFHLKSGDEVDIVHPVGGG